MTSGLQTTIGMDLGVLPKINVVEQAHWRIDWLAEYLRNSGASGYVLGISGGIDSCVAGRLAKIACDETGKTFTAMRLPYGTQADEHDAKVALAFIEPHETLTVNIKPATDEMLSSTLMLGQTAAQMDFMKGNIKARQRMVAQYAVAGAKGALVIGTDHAAEAVMGFFTKHGDGACDVTPLAGLTKRQVRAIGKALDAPESLIAKVPTADLEDDRPGLPDETVYGFSYDQIDDYLEGHPVPSVVAEGIEAAYAKTAHKRALPAAP